LIFSIGVSLAKDSVPLRRNVWFWRRYNLAQCRAFGHQVVRWCGGCGRWRGGRLPIAVRFFAGQHYKAGGVFPSVRQGRDVSVICGFISQCWRDGNRSSGPPQSRQALAAPIWLSERGSGYRHCGVAIMKPQATVRGDREASADVRCLGIITPVHLLGGECDGRRSAILGYQRNFVRKGKIFRSLRAASSVGVAAFIADLRSRSARLKQSSLIPRPPFPARFQMFAGPRLYSDAF
jgi:hypothetical protein